MLKNFKLKSKKCQVLNNLCNFKQSTVKEKCQVLNNFCNLKQLTVKEKMAFLPFDDRGHVTECHKVCEYGYQKTHLDQTN